MPKYFGSFDPKFEISILKVCVAIVNDKMFFVVAFVPLWMYTLGEYMLRKGDEDSELTLPFLNMAITLALLVVPLTIGILANKFFPKFGKQVLKWIQKPSMTLTIIFGVVMSELFYSISVHRL